MRNNLKELRLNLGMTQTDMAKTFVIPKSTYCNIENGRATGNIKFWIKLGVKMNFTVKQLENLMELS